MSAKRSRRRPSHRDRLIYWSKRAAALTAILAFLFALLKFYDMARAGFEAPVYQRIADHEAREELQAVKEEAETRWLRQSLRQIARGLNEQPGSRARTAELRRVYRDTAGVAR